MANPFADIVEEKPKSNNPFSDIVEEKPQGTISKAPPWYEQYPTSAPERFMGGIGKGLLDVGRGVGERLGVYTPEHIAGWRKEDAALMEGNVAGKIGEVAGKAIPFVTVPGGVAGGALSRAGTAALAGGGMGFVEPTAPGESVAGNVALGAATGGAMSGALSTAGKIINAIKEPLKQSIQQLSEKTGIRTTLGEVTQHPLIKKVETWLEEIPVIGLRKYRQKQQKEAQVAAKGFIEKFIHDPSAENIMEANRIYSKSLYEDMKSLIPGIDKQVINAGETRKAAIDMLNRYPDVFKRFQDNKTENLLRDIVKGTQEEGKPILGFMEKIKPSKVSTVTEKPVLGFAEQVKSEGTKTVTERGVIGTSPEGKPIYGMPSTRTIQGEPTSSGRSIIYGAPIQREMRGGPISTGREIIYGQKTTSPREASFNELWELREGIGQMIGQARKKLASGEVNESQLSQLKGLYKSVSNDMESWADKIGRSDIKEAFKLANEGYKQFVVRYDKLQRVYDKSIVKVGDEQFISPQRLAVNLKRDIIDKDKYVHKFTEEQVREMAGLENIMRVVHRAGQFKENPPTGLRYSLPITAGVLREAGIYAGLPITAVARFLTSTEAGKKIVLSASKVEPQSPAFLRIVNELYNQLPKATEALRETVGK